MGKEASRLVDEEESGADWLDRRGWDSEWRFVLVGVASSSPLMFLFWRIFLLWDVDVKDWAAVRGQRRRRSGMERVRRTWDQREAGLAGPERQIGEAEWCGTVHVLCDDLFSHVLNITAATVIRSKYAHSDIVASSHTSSSHYSKNTHIIIIFCSFHNLSCCQQQEAVSVKVFLACLQPSDLCWWETRGFVDMQSCSHEGRITCCTRRRRQLEIRAHPSPSRPAHPQHTTHTRLWIFLNLVAVKGRPHVHSLWTRRSDRLTLARCSFSAERLSVCRFLHTFSVITDSCLQMLFKLSCVRMLEGKLKQEQAELIVSLSGKRKYLRRSWNEAEWHVEMDL